MGKSEGKRGRSTNNVTIGSVLGSVARAHELVLGGRPRDNATQVRADSVQTILLESLVFLDNKVTDEKDERKKVSTNAKITS